MWFTPAVGASRGHFRERSFLSAAQLRELFHYLVILLLLLMHLTV